MHADQMSNHLPQRYKDFLQFFEVVDKSYVFLVKHRIKCTVTKLIELCSQLAAFTELSQIDEYKNIQKHHIVRLLSVCDDTFQLVDDKGNPTNFNNDHGEFQCVPFPGPGVGHSKCRKARVLNSLWKHLAKAVLSRDQTIPSNSEIDAEAKKLCKAGFEEGFNSECIAFPHEGRVQVSLGRDAAVATSSIELSPSNMDDANQYPFSDVIDFLKLSEFYSDQIKHIISFPSKVAQYQTLQMPLPSILDKQLRRRNVKEFFKHQAKAIDAIRAGKHCVVSTSTSSGKSLIYNIPVFEGLLRDNTATALYLFPTKALSQDQLRGIVEFIGDEPNIVPVVCDGDTILSDRLSIQQSRGNIVITNPDMIHHTLLPDVSDSFFNESVKIKVEFLQHKKWTRILQNLRWVVIDEAHYYSGAFGAHVACILRRLVRICSHNELCPQFIFCSATIANPRDHINRLVPLSLLKSSDLEVVTTEDDGAPHGEKCFMIWNPYKSDHIHKRMDNLHFNEGTNENSSIENDPELSMGTKVNSVSPIAETAALFSTLVKLKRRTIAFCGTRKLVELVYAHSSRYLSMWNEPDALNLISSYRGGYTDNDRRSIEQRLFNNQLLGVTTTCALELGVDIGSLDATIHMGFPGSFSSLWQQAGRAGRSGRPSLSIIVCYNAPLDQYFAKNPSELLRSDFENAILNIENVNILQGHLACAAKEIPLNYPFPDNISEAELWGTKYFEALKILLQSCKLKQLKSDLLIERQLLGYWSDSSQTSNEPTKCVNIRNIDPVTVSVLNDKLEVIDSVEYSRAFYELYEGAILMHRGKQYRVMNLDLRTNAATTSQVKVSYYTSGKNETQINIMKPIEVEGIFKYGIVQVISRINGFYKHKIGTGEIFEECMCSLPPIEYETSAFWIDLPMSSKRELERKNICAHEAIHAVNHLLVGLSSMIGQFDPKDIDTEHVVASGTQDHPFRLMIYDKRPGGLGSCTALYTCRNVVIQTAFQLIADCQCECGCPACVLDKRCTAHNLNVSKMGARVILQHLRTALTQDSLQPVEVALNSPTKRSKHSRLQHNVAIRQSEKSVKSTLQTNWTSLSPGFVTDNFLND